MFSLTRKKNIDSGDGDLLPHFAAADDGLARVALDESGTILYVSKGFSHLTGLEAGECQNRPADDFFRLQGSNSAAWRELPGGLYDVAFRGRPPVHFHFEWLAMRGSRRILLASQAVDTDAALKPRFYAPRPLSAPDPVTLPEAKIRSSGDLALTPLSEADWRCLGGMSRDILVIMGEYGEILSAAGAFEALGYEASALAGMDFMDLFHPEDKPFIRNTIQTLSLDAPDRTPDIEFEARVITRAGQARWMEWRQRREGARAYAIGRDVTAIKAQESALSRREQQLKEAESIGHMGHWHWTIGEETMEWSSQIYGIFGLSQSEFRPTFESMRAHIHRRDIDRLNQAFQRAIIEQNDYDMEFRVLRPHGETRFIRCEGRCAIDSQGEVYALYGIMQDMTEQTLHERELRAAKDAAEQAYAAKSQFLANMSHELRTPLNAIIGFSEMMQRQLLGPIGTEKYLEYIQGIRESGEHLLDLISDILDMSKIEAGKYELDLEEITVSKTLRAAVHMMETRAAEAGVKIDAAQALEADFTVVADRRALLQIALNLLSNAVKFTPRGGQVRIECSCSNETMVLTVSDNGIGIPAHKLASITRPFEQVSSHYTRDHEGSGLGLAITKELAELHGGGLHIESALGKGTRVQVNIPLIKART